MFMALQLTEIFEPSLHFLDVLATVFPDFFQAFLQDLLGHAFWRGVVPFSDTVQSISIQLFQGDVSEFHRLNCYMGKDVWVVKGEGKPQ